VARSGCDAPAVDEVTPAPDRPGRIRRHSRKPGTGVGVTWTVIAVTSPSRARDSQNLCGIPCWSRKTRLSQSAVRLLVTAKPAGAGSGASQTVQAPAEAGQPAQAAQP
jgi:hypothetical protein